MRPGWDKEQTLITEVALPLVYMDQMPLGQRFNLQWPWLSTGMLTHLSHNPIQWTKLVDKSTNTHTFSEALWPWSEGGQMCWQDPCSWPLQQHTDRGTLQRLWMHKSCFMHLYRDIYLNTIICTIQELLQIMRKLKILRNLPCTRVTKNSDVKSSTVKWKFQHQENWRAWELMKLNVWN